MSRVYIATWNLLGDDFQTHERLNIVARNVSTTDICALQEIVTLDDVESNTASVLARMTNMELASLADGELRNQVSKKMQSTAIITRLPIIQKDIIFNAPNVSTQTEQVEPKRYAGALLQSKSGRLILVVSLHLPWGGNRENRRLEHVLTVSQAIDDFMLDLPQDSIAILAGDFNTIPQADSLRFLRGESGNINSSSFWIDAWDEKRDGIGDTFNPAVSNFNIARTAAMSGIRRFELMPSRRIDYILVRGWAYGRPGSPLGSKLIGIDPGKSGLHGSDHYGIRTELWDPE